jgi:cytochrome oxidase Cu insertion factor (SCO1/SenC/PrrC family)
MKDKKKIFSLVLLILGLVMVVTGIVLICQMGASHSGHGGGLVRASTSIKFGGDFQTTSAEATGLAANAVIDVYKLLSFVSGMFFIFVGCVDICLTLMKTELFVKVLQQPVREQAQPMQTQAQPNVEQAPLPPL